MSLHDAIAAELPFLRQQAESRMTSRATIRRRGAATVVDDARVYSWTVVAADVPLRISTQGGSASPSSTDALGSARVEVDHLAAHLPVGTPLVAGDLLDVTAGETAPRVLRVISAGRRDQATALRVRVEDEPRPEEWA